MFFSSTRILNASSMHIAHDSNHWWPRMFVCVCIVAYFLFFFSSNLLPRLSSPNTLDSRNLSTRSNSHIHTHTRSTHTHRQCAYTKHTIETYRRARAVLSLFRFVGVCAAFSASCFNPRLLSNRRVEKQQTQTHNRTAETHQTYIMQRRALKPN